jgi:hypothetical protein
MSRTSRRIRDFFDRLLPAAMTQRGSALAAKEGAIGFIIPGAGEWILTLGGNAGLQEGSPLDADLVLMFSPAAFDGLLKGDVPKVGQGFAVDGDIGLLETIGHLLSPPAKGGLGARLRAF